MGQQYLENIDMFNAKEYNIQARSETAADFHKCLAAEFAKFIFDKQYGIFYYEPASKEEAQQMIESFERKLQDLRERYTNTDGLP